MHKLHDSWIAGLMHASNTEETKWERTKKVKLRGGKGRKEDDTNEGLAAIGRRQDRRGRLPRETDAREKEMNAATAKKRGVCRRTDQEYKVNEEK